MLGIGQFSKICQVSVKTLRHYDRIQLLTPAKIDPDTGYRYYREEQLSRMLLIRRLKRYGFSLDQIRDLLSCREPDTLTCTLTRQMDLLRQQVTDLQYVITELEQHLQNLERTGDLMSYKNQYVIHLTETEPIYALSCRQEMSVEEFGKYYGQLFETIAREGLHPAGPVLAVYHDQEFDPSGSDIEVAVSIAEHDRANRVISGCLCATTTHHGAYSNLGDAYGAIVQWLTEQEYEITGSPYEIYRKTQFDRLPPDQWETDIFFPVRKREKTVT